jgi:hypothetical protein
MVLKTNSIFFKILYNHQLNQNAMELLTSIRTYRLLFYTAIAIFFSGITGTAYGEPVPSRNGLFAFTHVNVIPMDNELILENQTVIVDDGVITYVGPADQTDIPEGAEIIDGNGMYLMPGLAEMHGHIPGSNRPDYAEDVLFLYISNGVTTVRNMAGAPYHLELRERVESNEIPGPAIYAAGPWLSPGNAGTPEQADRVVREQKEMGFDLLKMGSISRVAYEQMARTAHEIDMPFAGHIPSEVGLEGALEARQASIDHLDRYVEFLVPEDAGTEGRESGFLIDMDRIPEAVSKTIEAGTWNVPTLSLVEHLATPEPPEEMIQWPEMRYMPQDVLDGWVESKHNFRARNDFQPEAADRLVEVRRILTQELHDAGAPIALGSDAPQFFNVPGFSIHHELRMMVASGLTPYEVLVTGTKNPAIYFGTPDEFGTVEPGRRADLILLEANPLEDISNVQKRAGVMVRGEWWPENAIQQRLEEIAARMNRN